MKKCEHCGNENPDSAPSCGKCGNAFSPISTPSIPKAENRALQKKYWVLRIFVAACVWVVLTTISLHVAWHQSQKSELAWLKQWRTRDELKTMSNAIATYREETGKLPTGFDELSKMANQFQDLGYPPAKEFQDYWMNPLLFSFKGTNCVITSYGQDGKPGGSGIDCDLTTANPFPKEALPTYQQFLDNELCSGMVVWSYICGGLAALLSLLTVRIPNLRATGVIVLLLSLGGTIIGTLWTSTIITALHIPSGH